MTGASKKRKEGQTLSDRTTKKAVRAASFSSWGGWRGNDCISKAALQCTPLLLAALLRASVEVLGDEVVGVKQHHDVHLKLWGRERTDRLNTHRPQRRERQPLGLRKLWTERQQPLPWGSGQRRSPAWDSARAPSQAARIGVGGYPGGTA